MIDQLNVQFQKTRISLQGKFERLGYWDLHSLTLRPCVEKDAVRRLIGRNTKSTYNGFMLPLQSVA